MRATIQVRDDDGNVLSTPRRELYKQSGGGMRVRHNGVLYDLTQVDGLPDLAKGYITVPVYIQPAPQPPITSNKVVETMIAECERQLERALDVVQAEVDTARDRLTRRGVMPMTINAATSVAQAIAYSQALDGLREVARSLERI